MGVKEETPTDTKSKLPIDVNILKTTSAKGQKEEKNEGIKRINERKHRLGFYFYNGR